MNAKIPRIIDCFLFFNELDLLKLRLMETYDIVDYYILVESSVTFSGINKDFIFEQNKDMFKLYLDKIIHIKVYDTPNTNNPWEREIFQRDCILRGINTLQLHDNDILFITDCDEIINKKVLMYVKTHNLAYHMYSLNMDVYYYDFNYKSNEIWKSKVKLLKYKILLGDNCRVTPTIIRYTEAKEFPIKGGWHFTFFGGVQKIQEKLRGFSHQEYNTNNINNKEYLNYCKEIRKDLFDRNITIEKIDIQNNIFLPEHIKEKNFKNNIYIKNGKNSTNNSICI
jgi:beta-1,4-mannosyl-glycoprotein beta-1,4-N-acetylglucosaminyltransferase